MSTPELFTPYYVMNDTKRNVNIAIDFDDTITTDKEMWLKIIRVMKECGHTVKVVTARFDVAELNEDIINFTLNLDIDAICCGGLQKEAKCRSLGWMPDIWIDDLPWAIPLPSKLVKRATDIGVI